MSKLFNKISDKITKVAGSPYAFIIAFLSMIAWGVCGPFFNYSDTWELFVNTGTTIVTFLMMFLIQQSQNKGDMAIHKKLDELIRSSNARDEIIEIEKKTLEEIEKL